MSATGTKLLLADARAIADDLLSMIRGEAFVVGSIRRGEPEVGDIELAVYVNAVVDIPVGIGGLLPDAYETIKGGRKHWKFWQIRNVERGHVVDLYRFDDLNRGSITLMRTGPASFSKQFVTALRSQGYRHHEGYVRYLADDGSLVRCDHELVAFALAAMEWVEPEDRR